MGGGGESKQGEGKCSRIKKVEHKFEIAARMRTSSEFSHNTSRARELMLVSLLKARKLTMVGI